MTRRRPFEPRALLKLVMMLAVSGASQILVRGTIDAPVPAAGPTGRRPERGATGNADRAKRVDLTTYAIGYVLALLLTCAAFSLVYWRWVSGTMALAVIYTLALVQIIVHFRCFLHVDLRRSARDDLQLILFSTLIVCIMVGGTLVVLFNLRSRMM